MAKGCITCPKHETESRCPQDGWFTCNGVPVSQPMVFPPNHPTFCDQPKGMKVVLQKCSPWCHGILSSTKIQNVIHLQHDIVLPEHLNINLTFLLKCLLFKKLSKQLGTFALSSQNFTVSSISLNIFGVLWNAIFVSIAIIPLLYDGIIFQMHLDLWIFQQSGSGSTDWSDGWRLTRVVVMQKRFSC